MKGNGINHKSNQWTKTLHWRDIAKGQCRVFKRVKAGYGHEIAVHMAHPPGTFATRKDKGRDGAETKGESPQRSRNQCVCNHAGTIHR